LNYIGECTQIHEPATILGVVATMVLMNWLRRSCSKNVQSDEFVSMDAGQFAAGWLSSFAILLVAGPVFAWWGIALTLKCLFHQ
jgi:hypothetical protein